MKIRTAVLVTAITTVLALAVPYAALAGGRSEHGPSDGDAGHVLHMAKVLGLTDAQTTQIQAIVASHKEGAPGGARASMRDAREALARTIHDADATDDQVRDAAATVAALESQLAVKRHRVAIEIAAVLTPEQRVKLAELRASMMDHHRGRRFDGASGM
jgi:Spy/CpxP family protein refolding chaperone